MNEFLILELNQHQNVLAVTDNFVIISVNIDLAGVLCFSLSSFLFFFIVIILREKSEKIHRLDNVRCCLQVKIDGFRKNKSFRDWVGISLGKNLTLWNNFSIWKKKTEKQKREVGHLPDSKCQPTSFLITLVFQSLKVSDIYLTFCR